MDFGVERERERDEVHGVWASLVDCVSVAGKAIITISM